VTGFSVRSGRYAPWPIFDFVLPRTSTASERQVGRYRGTIAIMELSSGYDGRGANTPETSRRHGQGCKGHES
jgi:hypothetical protein